MKWKSILATGVAMFGLTAGLHADGFLALEGSDAAAGHFDTTYTTQLFKYLQGSSSLNVLVLGKWDLSGNDGNVGITMVQSLTNVNLSLYSALYVEAPNPRTGPPTADPTALDGHGLDVNAFIQQGGNVAIEDYLGGSYNGVVVGGATAPAGSMVGFGIGGDTSFCSDAELVNPGNAAGFTQPGTLGCWEHQAYEMSYWGGQGYTSLINSTGVTFGDSTTQGSGFLVLNRTTNPNLPEPGTLGLLGLSLAGIVATRKRFPARAR